LTTGGAFCVGHIENKLSRPTLNYKAWVQLKKLFCPLLMNFRNKPEFLLDHASCRPKSFITMALG
jgi:hypothetical protein